MNSSCLKQQLVFLLVADKSKSTKMMLLSRSEVVAKVSLSKFFLTCFSSRSNLRTRHVGYGDNDKTDFFIKTTYSWAEL